MENGHPNSRNIPITKHHPRYRNKRHLFSQNRSILEANIIYNQLLHCETSFRCVFSWTSFHPWHTFTALRFCFLRQNHHLASGSMLSPDRVALKKMDPKKMLVGKRWLEFWIGFSPKWLEFWLDFHQNGWRVKVDWNSLLIRCIQSRKVRFCVPHDIHMFIYFFSWNKRHILLD